MSTTNEIPANSLELVRILNRAQSEAIDYAIQKLGITKSNEAGDRLSIHEFPHHNPPYFAIYDSKTEAYVAGPLYWWFDRNVFKVTSERPSDD